MKKIKSLISLGIAFCLLATSMFTGVFALSEDTDTLREQIISAISGIEASNTTTASDIENAVTTINSSASVEWKLAFQNINAINGVKIKVGDTEYGEVTPHDGSVTGIISVTSGTESFNIPINLTIKAAYDEAIACDSVKEVTITSSSDTFASLGGDLSDKNQLVIINSETGNIPKKFMGTQTDSNPQVTDTAIKAIIVKDKVVVLVQAFCRLQAMKALVFEDGVTGMSHHALRASNALTYLDLGSAEDTTLSLGNAASMSYLQALPSLYIGGYAGVEIGNTTFEGNKKLTNIIIDCPVESVGTTPFQDGTSTFNIYCSDSTSASKFTTGTVIDLSQRAIIDFYYEASAISSCASTEEVESALKALPSYSEAYALSVVKATDGFVVTINELLELTVPMTDTQYIKDDVADAISNFSATNETVSDDVLNAINEVSGVESVAWSSEYGFQKILATDGAEITLNGVAVENGIVKGHYGSITGIVIITTSFGDTFDVKVGILINPTYEVIDCTKSATVTITNSTDTFANAEGYDAGADLVIININNSTGNIPENYFGANTDSRNDIIKAVIINSEVNIVLERAFQYTSALQAVAFNGVEAFNNYAFYASGIKYVDFGDNSGALKFSKSNTFAWCINLKTLYIGGYASVNILEGAFTGCRSLSQIYADVDNIEGVTTGALNTNSSGNASITTVVCKNDQATSLFNTAGAKSTFVARTVSDSDVNWDFCVDIRDLVWFNVNLADISENSDYDLDESGLVDVNDQVIIRKVLLGIS